MTAKNTDKVSPAFAAGEPIMSAPVKQTITSLPVSEIQVEERLRMVSQSAVETLIVSISELGHILHPLQVQKVKGGYRLLDGMHRLEAAKALNRPAEP